MTFINKDKILINFVKTFFISIGIPKKQIFLYERDDVDFLIIRSYPISYIFNKIFDVPIGKKREINIKEFVISNRNYCRAAIRGAFDAEGSITFTGSRRISITSNSKLWLVKMKGILESLNIKSQIYKETRKRKNPLYRMFIYHIVNLKRFHEIIQPIHSKKKDRLKQIIEDYDKNPVGIFRKKILKSIQDGKNRRKDIAKYMNLKLYIVHNNINWLRKNGLIEPRKKVYSNNGCYFEYVLTNKGKKFLKEDSLPFFD